MRWLKDYQDRMAKAGGKNLSGPGNLLLQWHVTDRCNLRCSHCYQEAYSGPELGFEDLLKAVEQYRTLLAALGVRRGHINVTGGEPFVREDFIPFLDILSRHRDTFSFAILTNGSFIDEAQAARIRRLGPAFVQLSMEGGRETHDAIRGEGDFERVGQAARNLRQERVRTFLSFTVHKGNYREFGEVAEEGIRLGVARIWTDRFIPLGNGTAMADKVLSPHETGEFFEMVRKMRERTKRWWRRGDTEIAMGRALQFIAGGGEPYRCAAGGSLLALGADGILYPCRRMPVPLGNVTTEPMAALYREHHFLASLRNRRRIARGCEGCFYARACGGGLRCLSYAAFGDPFRADPGCPLARQGESRCEQGLSAACI